MRSIVLWLSKDRVIAVYAQNLIDAARLQTANARTAAATRAYMLSGDPRYLEQEKEAQQFFARTLDHMKPNLFTPEGRAMISDVQQLEEQHRALAAKVQIAMRQANVPNAASGAIHARRSISGNRTPLFSRRRFCCVGGKTAE